MAGSNIILNIGDEVKAKIFDKENPKRTAPGVIIEIETYPCGMKYYSVELKSGKIVFRCQNELVLLQPLE